MEELKSLTAKLKAVLQEICRDNSVKSPAWSDYVEKAVTLAESFTSLQRPTENHMGILSELEAAAVNLWNYSVALKTKGSVGVVGNAKLRYVTLLMVNFCSGNDNDDNTLKKKIMMGLKTGRAWLDCSYPGMAQKVLNTTAEFVEKLQQNIVQRKNSGDVTMSDVVSKQKLEAELDLFKLMCYRTEAAVALGDHQEAASLALLAKELVPKFPKEGGFLSMLCYNFGVDTYQQKLFENAISWLRESFELGKGRPAIGPKNQARTLRLLANAYLELNAKENLQKALNAVSLANTEYCHPAGLYLKLRIALLNEAADDVVKRAIEDLAKLPELSSDFALNVLQLVSEHKRNKVVTWAIEVMLRKFHNTPDIGKLLVTNFEVLIQGGQIHQAKEFVEFCITGHHTGKPLDPLIKKRFHLVFWEQAAAAFESKQYEEALEWYNYSLSLYTQIDPGDRNLAKLQRNRATCCIYIGQIDKAKSAILESNKYEPNSTHTQYLMHKIAVMEGNNKEACATLQKLCELAKQDSLESLGDSDSPTCGLICLAAQQAFEEKNTETSTIALECLSNCSPDQWQVLTALRCLVRLKLSALDQENTDRDEMFHLVNHIRTAYNKLLQLQDERRDNLSQVHSEANWFMKIAWNLALQCEENPLRMKELFGLCSQLTSLCPMDDSTLNRQKTCMLMSAAACLQVARTTQDEHDKELVLEETLDHVDNCRQLCGRMQTSSLGADKRGKETEVLLLLYEFEARIKLKDPKVEAVLERALTLPNPDPKTFEALAALSMEPESNNKSVSVRVLKVAIHKHLQVPQPDIVKCSKLFHSLIQLSMSGSGVQDLTSKDEAWNYYIEVLDIIDKKSHGQYPEMEILWLMTKAWNCGINFYSASLFKKAEKWCGLSMRMLKYLNTMKSSYQEHMNTIYAEILSKMEQTKERGSLEE